MNQNEKEKTKTDLFEKRKRKKGNKMKKKKRFFRKNRAVIARQKRGFHTRLYKQV